MLVLFVLFASALCFQHCLPPQFTYDSWMADPEKSFDDTQKVMFDFSNKRTRVDVFMMDPVATPFQVYQFFDRKTQYTYDVKKDNCIQQPLLHEMELVCLMLNASREREVFVGTSKCDAYFEPFGTQPHEGGAIVVLEQKTLIPVSVMAVGPSRKTERASMFEAFYNFQGTVDPSVFSLPSACK